jgi:cephalosporin hydroxylase
VQTGHRMSLLRRFANGARRFGKFRMFPDPTLNGHFTEFEVDKWVVSDFVANRLIPIVGTHPYPLDELLLMAAALCRLKPTHIFEWGTHVGKSARIFFETSKAFGIATEIHSIDLPDASEHPEHPGHKRGLLVKDIPEVRLHQGDGLEESMKICKQLRDKAQPLFFLDGDHEYASVMRELVEIMTRLPDASILVHDTFYQSAESGYNIGPHRAITDALTSTPNRYKEISTNIGLPGMTLLYVL